MSKSPPAEFWMRVSTARAAASQRRGDLDALGGRKVVDVVEVEMGGREPSAGLYSPNSLSSARPAKGVFAG